MVRSKVMRIVLVAGSVLIILGVALMGWMIATEDERNVIQVQLDEGATYPIEFESLSLVPGEECEYTVTLKSGNAERYDLRLDFAETEGEKTLKNYARVRITANGEILYDELLAAAFENEELVLPVDFTEKKNTELQLVYYLPIDVGNEAKGAEAVFELRLTASNE